MSIHFISGKPGGGKTLYSVRLIVDELVNGNRPIVTNVPLKLGELNRYLQDKHPSPFQRRFTSTGRHITDDVIVLDEDDLPKFFTHRGNGVRLESVSNAEWKQGKRPDFTAVKDSGVLYVLDEVHIAFNSRAWADTGAEVLYYLSQHRKLGDDVVCITQSIGNVDKQFRSVAQDFTYIKNLSKQRAGLFRLPSLFTRNTYAQPATDTSKPMESGSFTLDVTGLASLYDTARGVGIHGRAGADTNGRKKGVHWMVALIGIPLFLWAAVHFTPKILVGIMSPNKPANVSLLQNTNDVKTNAPSQKPKTQKKSDRSTANESALSADEIAGSPVPQPICLGYLIANNHASATFSDGTVITETEGLQRIEPNAVWVLGSRYPIAPAKYKPQKLEPSLRFDNDEPRVVAVPQPPLAPVNQADVTVIGSRTRPAARPTNFGFKTQQPASAESGGSY